MQERLLLRVEEAAEALRLSRAKVYELIARGELRVVRIDRAARIPVGELQRFVRELSGGAEASGAEVDHGRLVPR